jgi:hypothetical protein
MAQRKAIYFDGEHTKALTLGRFDEFMDWAINKDGTEATEKSIYQAVPWVFRGTRLRCEGVGSMPFEIRRGDEVVDSSDDYQNVLGWLPDPVRLFKQIEASNTLAGRWYIYKVQNRAGYKDLRYFSPETIRPKLDEARGLIGWERRLNGRWVGVPLDKIAYYWDLDPYVEFGPPTTSPGHAALAAAGVLMDVDTFASKFAKRGMIKATILRVPQGTSPDEKDRLKTWFGKIVMGMQNAWATHVLNADAVEPEVIGEGLDVLSNLELTDEKRKDIATALGVPSTKLWSGDAGGLGGGGVVGQDDKRFATDTIVPECKNTVAGPLNRQIFNPMGLSLHFLPETLDVFQEDEAQRAQAFGVYSQKFPAWFTAMVLGMELPDGMGYYPEGMELPTLFEIEQQRQEQAMEIARARGNTFGGGGNDDKDKDRRDDEKRWRSIALRELKAGRRPEDRAFDSDHIPDARALTIRAALAGANTEQEVKAAFSGGFPPSYP